jgi:NTP pyrophosphatase (non-canonical NTP hydrolase)
MNKEILNEVSKFNSDRNWDQFHNGKDLALSLSLEASELLEIYQWSMNDLECNEKLDQIKEELADVFLYAIQIAEHYHLDIDDIIKAKLKKNAVKYPISKAKDSKEKYDKLK